MTRILTVLGLLLAAGSAGCDRAPTAPGAGDERIDVQVTGGIAAADYAYRVQEGAVTGVACRRLCDFAAGDTLLLLTPAQSRALADAVDGSGLPAWTGPEDSGTQCCDQFHYRVTWSWEARVRTFGGTEGLLPEPFRELVRTLQLLRRATPPVVLSQDTGLQGFAADALHLHDARVEGGVLEVDAGWSGGCTVHDVDAVAWTGWMESWPVQVGVAVTHDAHGDACKALVRRTLRFDLEPLRRAYAEAYGGGPATLVLQVGAAAGGEGRSVPFAF
ncbi:MAG TPA: protealysin inhibitor emfourin [Longimicrobiales bacterium]|nr:protealysin inhibitor emfourin [Longimicrobiales bacterium]